jgi:hypothetical protein
MIVRTGPAGWSCIGFGSVTQRLTDRSPISHSLWRAPAVLADFPASTAIAPGAGNSPNAARTRAVGAVAAFKFQARRWVGGAR